MTLSSRLASLVLWLSAVGPSVATNPAMGLVPHPVNLGSHADPGSIPLSAVAVWHNYGYGIHPVISRARLFPAGSLATPQGREYDMNLASVFDIRIIPEDPTQVPAMPVVLKIGGGAAPPYSPYTRAQVIEATLWCLVFSAPASEKHPLVVIIDSPDPADLSYAGSYVWSSETWSLLLGEIPGSKPVRDERGVVSIVIKSPGDRAAPFDGGAGPELAFVPLLSGGGAEGDDQIALVPHWTGAGGEIAPLELMWTAIPRAMNVFSAKRGENANPLHSGTFDTQLAANQRSALSFIGASSADRMEAGQDLRRFAAACHAALLTAAPSEEEPFRFSFSGYPSAAWEVLGADGWEAEDGPHGSRTWRKSFTDARQTVLGHRLVARPEGGWWVELEPPLPEARAEIADPDGER